MDKAINIARIALGLSFAAAGIGRIIEINGLVRVIKSRPKAS